MRPHLIKCLEAEKAESFPVKKCRRKLKKIKSTLKVLVSCTCRMPKRSDCTMIECSACRESLHVDICVDVNTRDFDRSTKWLCTSCMCNYYYATFITVFAQYKVSKCFINVFCVGVHSFLPLYKECSSCVSHNPGTVFPLNNNGKISDGGTQFLSLNIMDELLNSVIFYQTGSPQ